MRDENVLKTHFRKNNMSLFDYFWKIEMDKDGITFSDAIKTFKIDRDRALECLKSVGHPVDNNNDILTLKLFRSFLNNVIFILLIFSFLT